MQCFWCKGDFDETFTLSGDSRKREFCHDCLDSISNDPIDVAIKRRVTDAQAEECHLEEARERELVSE